MRARRGAALCQGQGPDGRGARHRARDALGETSVPPTIDRGLAREPAGHEVPMVRGRGVGGRALEEEEMAGRGAGTAPERIDD